ncbi:unnamed protein product [Sphagnum jensenii]|uniref:EF-hand domain-containing protein n=1 Tax=Sphagnum jensenii TaxID=128206 RepID=A0ABP0XDZ0_9BRYO
MKFPFFSKKKKANNVSLGSSDSSGSSSAWSCQSSSSRDRDSSHSWKVMFKFSRRSGGSVSNRATIATSSASLDASSPSGEQHRDVVVAPFDRTEELTEAFRYFDMNGDGKISATELGFVLHSLGIESTDKELQEMVDEVDADGDGFIDLQEFINLNRRAMEAIERADGAAGNSGDDIRAAFHVFDIDGNGFISADELHRVLSGLGEKGLTIEDCRCMINSVDRNGDGRVDFAEFQCMMLDTRVF